MFAHHGSTPQDTVLVLVPVSLLAAALFFANRRAQRQLDEHDKPPEPDQPDQPDQPD